MCGIVGYFGSKDVDLTPAARAILHRGPDMQGIASGVGWRIAFNRLAIIDTSANGMQPFTFDGVTVVMNGEIYNYRELKDEHRHEYCCRSGSDVEILPFLYRKYGIRFLQRLNGMFAMVLIDENAGRYFLIRDRFGKKPIFYRRVADAIYFASELKALKHVVKLIPDRTNLALNLACWLVVQPLTPYEHVFQVNPGHYLQVDGAKAVEHLWYEPRIISREQLYEEIRTNFMALYRRSIDLRLRSDVPVGVCLSGGLDSSSMAYIARESSPDNFVAFTAQIVGKETWEGTTDTENPRRLCADLGIRQLSTNVDAIFWNRNIVDIAHNYDEIFINSGTLVFYAISAAARSVGVKVLLSGVGGDELLGGYPWQARARALSTQHLIASMHSVSPAWTRWLHKLWSRLGPGGVRTKLARAFRLFAQFQVWHAQSLSSALVPYMRDADDAVAQRIESFSENYFRIATMAVDGDPCNRMNYANIFTVIANQNYQLDMACMRHSVENRSPLLDFNMVEYLMSVPDYMKNKGGPKLLMRDMLSEFLPRYITSARKSGPTMPLHQWYGQRDAGGVGSSVRRFLHMNRQLVGDLVSGDLAARMADESLYDGQAGVMRLFALVSFVIWAKLNVEGSIPDPSISFTELAHT
jgi:asparagine synthase (glutamine-hydrolysing)